MITAREASLAVGSWYTNEDGLSLKVIGMGTKGVVVEYVDGSAELIDRTTWRDLDMEIDELEAVSLSAC
jgi:hypothetical protein